MIYEKHSIGYRKYCYKMKIFNTLWSGVDPDKKCPMKQLSSMHKQTALKHII